MAEDVLTRDLAVTDAGSRRRTGAALSPSLARPVVVGILGRELVSTYAGGGARSLSRPAVTAADVLPVRDRLQVIGAHALAIPAEMVDVEPLRNRPDEQLVPDAMGEQYLPFTRTLLDLPVAVAVQRAGPEPTRSRAIDLLQPAHAKGLGAEIWTARWHMVSIHRDCAEAAA